MNTIDTDVLKALAELANSYGKKLNITVETTGTFKLETTISIGGHAYSFVAMENGSFVAALGKLTRGLALENETEVQKET